MGPYRIHCWVNGVQFLKKQIGSTLFYRPNIKLSRVGQLFVWRVRNNHVFQQYDWRADQFNVKVLLVELTEKEPLIFESKNGFVVQSLKDSNKKLTIYGTKLSVEARSDKIVLNRKQFPLPLSIEAVKDTIVINGDEYKGTFLLIPENKKILVINKLALEDYVYSVLRSESWPGWPVEVNKAFAIASRSYAMAKVLESIDKKQKKQYHIKNTNIHQTYKGYHSNEKLLQAVHETDGIILAYDKKPILAMFDCCCGGVVPAKLSNVDFLRAPYLQRSQVCTFCESSKIYRWNLEISIADFIKILCAAGYKVYSIKDIQLHYDDAGAVQKVAIKDGSHNTVLDIPGKKLYSLIKKIKSYCYSITKNNRSLIIQGKGYGHHLGLCQWGARRMIDHGFTYRNILEFYYPGASFMKVALNK